MKESRLIVHKLPRKNFRGILQAKKLVFRFAQNNQSGQSLVELIIALGVILMVLLSLASIGLVSVKNSDMAKTKSLATSYAREGMEYARKFRDANSAGFISNCNSGFQNQLVGLPTVPSPFTRTVTCSVVAVGKYQVEAKVSWTDDKGTHSSDLFSYFTDKGSWQ